MNDEATNEAQEAETISESPAPVGAISEKNDTVPPVEENAKPSEPLVEGASAPMPTDKANEQTEANALQAAVSIEALTEPEKDAEVNPAPAEPPARPPLKTLRLPNATVGRNYFITGEKLAQSIQQAAGTAGLRLVSAQLSADLGLIFSTDPTQISGLPTLAGEHRFELEFRIEGADGMMFFDAALTVNPDPTSLWKNKPSPENGPYYKKEQRTEEVEAGQLSMLAASQRGRSHAHEGTFRDDEFSLSHLPENSWWLAAVSDGAGSAKYSRRGSQLACDVAMQHMRNFLSKSDNEVDKALAQEGEGKPGLKTALYHLLPTAAYDAYKAIESEVAKPSEDLPAPPSMRDYAATLILMAAKKIAQGWFVATFAIGAGGAGCVIYDGSGVPLTKADGGDFAGQTMFVTMPGIFKPEQLMARLETRWLEDFQALVLMSDGVTDPKFASDAAFADPEKWRDFWDEVKVAAESEPGRVSVEKLLAWLSFPSPGNHDDRTIALIVPKPSATAKA